MSHLQSLHESLGARAGNGTEVLDQVVLGHTNTSILNGKGLGLLVGGDANLQRLLSIQLGRVGQRQVADLVDGIARVRNELTKKNLLHIHVSQEAEGKGADDILEDARRKEKNWKKRNKKHCEKTWKTKVITRHESRPCSSRRC